MKNNNHGQRLVACLLLSMLLSACGQPGPLYLPKEPAKTLRGER
ncbi:MAG: lipoprotein [Legionellaceae bacterium]|nr:lipoprotein [Legionellaceae bacterium]